MRRGAKFYVPPEFLDKSYSLLTIRFVNQTASRTAGCRRWILTLVVQASLDAQRNSRWLLDEASGLAFEHVNRL
jgi:hypothetical protein